jgi:hypothetical protein
MEKSNHIPEFEYEKPAISDYGDLTQLTAAHGAMNHLDATFPSGTPFGSLTFS